jgi:hypothetical protein
LSKWSDTHRADADLAGKNDRVPFWRQWNLELTQENKISKSLCALRQARCHKIAATVAAHVTQGRRLPL